MARTLIIIPHYNKITLLKECLSYIDSNYNGTFDVMIVDNGSTDGSSQYIYELSQKNNHYHSILLSDNMGFAYAVNAGLQYSLNNDYEFSILLNNDAFIEKNFVNKLVNKIEESKKIFAVSSMMLNFSDTNIIDSFGDYYTILGWSFQGHIAEKYDDIENDELPFSACAGAAIYRNSIINQIGLFDENFFAYLEDIDISYRAKLYGYVIKTCKDAICYHIGSGTTGSKYNEFKVRISARNNIYLLYKNMPYVQILINIFPLFIGHIVKLIFFIHKGFGLDYFFGIVDGFRNVNKVTKVNFRKINVLAFFKIEIELITNMFKYIVNFTKRHFNEESE